MLPWDLPMQLQGPLVFGPAVLWHITCPLNCMTPSSEPSPLTAVQRDIAGRRSSRTSWWAPVSEIISVLCPLKKVSVKKKKFSVFWIGKLFPPPWKICSQGIMQNWGKTVRTLCHAKGQHRSRMEENSWGWTKVAGTFLRWPSISTAPCSTSFATGLGGGWRWSRTGHRHPGPVIMFTLLFANSTLFACGRAVQKHLTVSCSSGFVIWWKGCTQY